MEISPTTPGATSVPKSTANGAINTDFQMFLKMLTTQMQNQDPLNPVDSADYAVQLATFSGVEQQVKTNQMLEQLATQMGSSGMAQLASWVGMEARTTSPVRFTGQPIELAIAPDPVATRAELVVSDSKGNVVLREPAPTKSGPMDWVGVDAKGEPLPKGVYTFQLESYVSDRLLKSQGVAHYSAVQEAQIGPTGTTLILDGGVQVAASEVTALRNP